MSNRDMQQVNATPNGNSLDMTSVAMLGATLAGLGLEALEVQGLLASVQKTSMQTAMNAMPEVLTKIAQVQRAKAIDLANRISMLPSMGGYINKLQVLQIINNVMSAPPQQQQ